MPSAAEVKGRIKSIEDTRKITNAMYLIASTKLRRAKNDLERTRPYFYALRNEIKRIFRTVRDVEDIFLTSIISPLSIHFCIQRRIPPWTGPGR